MPFESTKLFVYKLLALITFGVALALGLVVLHFSLAQAEILVIANQIPINVKTEILIPISNIGPSDLPSDISSPGDELTQLRNLILGLEEQAQPMPLDSSLDLNAEIHEIGLDVTHIVIPEGQGKKLDAQASGEVTIYNDANYNQGLVTTTRLLTPEGVLFRITKGVNVPAGGTVRVEARADGNFKGEIGNIGPTTFSIPGLLPAKQKFIYAKNEQPFSGGVSIIKTLAEEDFTRAQNEAAKILRERALQEFSKLNLAVPSNSIELSEFKYETDDKPGQEKSKLTISASAKAKALVFDDAPLLATAKLRLAETLPPTQIILAYNLDSFHYEILRIDAINAVASVSTYLEGFAALADNNSLMEPEKLAGLKAEEIQALLMQNQAVQEVQVKFSPFWVSHAPRLVDKITIVLKKE